MLRNKNLIPLSHQHQRALALCVRIDRSAPIPDVDLAAWQAEIRQIVDAEIHIHFAAEEEVVFPAARRFPELIPLVSELISDHEELRAKFTRATEPDAASRDLEIMAQHLSSHIRKEERQLFERMQQLMTAEELSSLGEKLAESLKLSEQTCILPTDATRLRPVK